MLSRPVINFFKSHTMVVHEHYNVGGTQLYTIIHLSCTCCYDAVPQFSDALFVSSASTNESSALMTTDQSQAGKKKDST